MSKINIRKFDLAAWLTNCFTLLIFVCVTILLINNIIKFGILSFEVGSMFLCETLAFGLLLFEWWMCKSLEITFLI